MTAILEVESTLTDRYQTTVPETVRRALKLGKRDKIHYTIRPGGEVVLTRVDAAENADPVLGQFLRFLARDIAAHPAQLQVVGANLIQRIDSLVGGIPVPLEDVWHSATGIRDTPAPRKPRPGRLSRDLGLMRHL